MPESFLGTQGSGASLSAFIFLSLVVSKFEFSLGAFGFVSWVVSEAPLSLRCPTVECQARVMRPTLMWSQFLTCRGPVFRLNRAVIQEFERHTTARQDERAQTDCFS